MNQPGHSSGQIAVTAGTQTVTGPGVLLHAGCVAGSAAGTVSVYDGTSTSGTLICSLAAVPIGTTQETDYAQGVAFETGLFIVVSGTGSTGSVVYRKN